MPAAFYRRRAFHATLPQHKIGFGFDGPKTAIPFLPIFRGLLERDAKATRTPGMTSWDLNPDLAVLETAVLPLN